MRMLWVRIPLGLNYAPVAQGIEQLPSKLFNCQQVRQSELIRKIINGERPFGNIWKGILSNSGKVLEINDQQ